MKILIDGHNLALKEPTGVGIYARNLAFQLSTLNHDVSILYGINHKNIPWLSKESQRNSFYRQLINVGEEPSKGYHKWAFYLCFYLKNILLNKGVSPETIELNKVSSILKEKIPTNSNIFNLINIFRVSQAFSAVTGLSIPLDQPVQFKDIDVFHSTMPLPLRKKNSFKKVVTLHDLIPLKLSKSIRVNVSFYRKILRASLKDADLIFSISEQTKLDAIELLGINPEKIHVTYQTSYIPKRLRNLSKETINSVIRNYGLCPYKYFLFYGTLEPKKNVYRFMKAFKDSNTDCKLVVVGKDGWRLEREKKYLDYLKSIEFKKIIRIHYIDPFNLISLLKGCKALIFPSLYEGFGLPILEAMQLGVPVITSQKGSIPEIGGDAVHYIDPYSIQELKSAFEEFSYSETILNDLKIKGLSQSKKFSASNYRRRLEQGYNKLF